MSLPSGAALDRWFEKVESLPDVERLAMVKWAKAELARERSLAECATPAYTAKSVDPTYVITPAIELIGQALERATTTRRGRLLITMPPQEGKTELTAVWTVIRCLQRNPDTRIILASYSQDLAEGASVRARNYIAANGTDAIDPITRTPAEDKLGIRLAHDKAAASHWRIAGHKGGLNAVGLNGTITGKAADLIIVDDPLKGMQASDSKTERAKVISTYQGDLTTRLSPSAPLILIQTRWNEEDLAGFILKSEALKPPEKRRWEHINIPALATEGIADALGRAPGTWLESSRGRRLSDWIEIQETVGTRVFSALYQGTPTPTGGGLFSKDDFDRYRVQSQGTTVMRLVSIDPAETGKNDEAGVVGASVSADGHVYWTHDWSGHMTSDGWARKGVILALTIGASELSYEAYTTEQTYGRVIKQAWRNVRDQAAILRAAGGDIDIAARVISEMEDRPRDPAAALQEIAGLQVPETADPPFIIRGYRGKGDKTARATGAMQASSTGRLRIVGTLPVLESQASTWQLGQNSPDRMDAAVNAYNRLCDLTGAQSVIVTPQQAQAQMELQGGAGMESGLASMLSVPFDISDRA